MVIFKLIKKIEYLCTDLKNLDYLFTLKDQNKNYDF